MARPFANEKADYVFPHPSEDYISFAFHSDPIVLTNRLKKGGGKEGGGARKFIIK